MKKAFTTTFDAIVIEPTGPNSLYARFLEIGRSQPIYASGVSDGHLQLLILLTTLFSEGKDRFALLLYDEPETSLHPWALAVLAEAMIEASERWNKQILVATHSPVLISQFEASQILSVEPVDGHSAISRLSEQSQIADLLEHYTPGNLYMSEMVAPQSKANGSIEARPGGLGGR
jgi:predicted ATPase